MIYFILCYDNKIICEKTRINDYIVSVTSIALHNSIYGVLWPSLFYHHGKTKRYFQLVGVNGKFSI
jgi:hypothetical protein